METVIGRPARRSEAWAAGLVLLLLGRAFVNLVAGDKTGVPPFVPIAAGEMILQLLAYGGALVLALTRPRQVGRALGRDLGPAALSLLAVASIAWSVAPLDTLRGAAGMVAATLFGAYLASTFRRAALIRLVACTLVAATLLSFVAVLLLPGVGVATSSHEGSWTGIYDHKNALGMRLALAFAALPALLVRSDGRRRRRLWWLAGVGIALVLVASQSKSSAAIAGALIVLVPVLLRVRRRPLEGAIVTIAALLAASLALIAVPYAGDEVLEVVNPRGTLLGRAELWGAVSGEVAQRPLLGYGLNAFWQDGRGADAAIREAFPWGPGHSHNGALEMLLGLGALGLTVAVAHLMAVVLRAARRSHAQDAGPETLWAALFVAWYLLSNVTYSNLGGQSAFHWTLYVAVALQLSRRSLFLRDLDRRAHGVAQRERTLT